ncbi:single-stranded DNA-binding protein [Mycoplasma suis]|nr:single-stranded DNA-binding protein [Mycoplasma suis]CBZ40113.1 Single-stranded DNA-binding protein [Mycoplasma suis KI3806]
MTNSSLDYSRFSIACSENYTRANQSAKTHYFHCIAWGKRAQYISTYLKKGDSVFIEFTLLTSSYTNMEGRIIRKIDLQVEKIEMLYQRLNRSLDSSGTISSESNPEDKDILKEQADSLSSSSLNNSSSEEDSSTGQLDLDLSEIYKDNEEEN